MASLITRLDLDDRLTTDNIRRYAIQCSLATVVVLILLIALDTVSQTVLIAALGATAFIAFAVPRSVVSSPRCLIGGYLVGMFAGALMSSLNASIGISDAVMAEVSMIVFGALATGTARTLVHRAGAVALKEGWPLVLGFRETPLSIVHLENLRRLAYQGAVILPPMPAFYIGGDSLDRFLDHYCLRVLDRLGLEASGDPSLRWGG